MKENPQLVTIDRQEIERIHKRLDQLETGAWRWDRAAREAADSSARWATADTWQLVTGLALVLIVAGVAVYRLAETWAAER